MTGLQTFHAIADVAPDMMWTAGADGALDWINERARTLSGRPEQAFLGDAWLDIVHPDDRETLARRWRTAVARRMPLQTEARMRGADERYRWLLIKAQPTVGADGETVMWIGTNTDVDALKAVAEGLEQDNAQLEQDIFKQLHEVRLSQARLQAYFDACPDYIYLLRLSKTDGLAYEDVNPATVRLYGLDRSQIIGRAPIDIDDAATAAGIEANVRRCLATGRTVNYLIERKTDGRPPVFVQAIGAPIEYFNEEEGLVLFCGRDITEQRNVEEALRQSQKMEAVGQLTGGLAHDFNNLLTGIIGSLDLLRTRVTDGRYDKVDRYVDAAQGAAARAASLTHRLLAFSRRQTLDPKPTDVNRLAAGMEDLLRRTAGPEITLHVTLCPAPWNVLVDPSQLENALLNLCINARDAMPGGGSILIETRNTRLSAGAAGNGDLAAGDYVGLSVTDTGTGMSPEIMKRIFDPFFTTKPIGSGTGLGLSMIYGFAQQSGGQIRVHSTVGVGTTMRLLLPRHVGEAEATVARADLSAAPRSQGHETVLVVDDDATVRMLIVEVLGELGYTVMQASDGRSGIAVLESDAVIDLLVTDVGLPGGVNGRQVAEAGRTVRPALKIMFITGYAENAVLNHGHLDRDMQIITKPFAMETLANRVRLLIGKGD